MQTPSTGRLDGKVAIVTGGASGIGAGTARRFVEEGARVLIADLDAERGGALAAELGDAAAFLQTDVSREEQVAAMVCEAADRWGRLDCLLNNLPASAAPSVPSARSRSTITT